MKSIGPTFLTIETRRRGESTNLSLSLSLSLYSTPPSHGTPLHAEDNLEFPLLSTRLSSVKELVRSQIKATFFEASALLVAVFFFSFLLSTPTPETNKMRKALDLSWGGLGLPLAVLIAAHVILLAWLFLAGGASTKAAADAKKRAGPKRE